jgi:adenylate cyclase
MAKEKISLAVLFADVSDSTRMYESLGDTMAFGNVHKVIELLMGVTKAFNGRVVKQIGDGLMCAFPDADGAAGAAGEMQRQIMLLPPLAGGKKLAIRVGFHYGPAIRDGDEVFGDGVHMASRMAGLALSGQAVTDSETVAALSSSLRDTMRRLDALAVKGETEGIEVHELMWQASSDRTVIPDRIQRSAASRTGGPTMKLTYRGSQLVVKSTVYLGRDASNTIFIMDSMASRRHAKIELRAGKFVLVDQSSNGTFVTMGSSPEVKLKREETILHGTGIITFGHGAAEVGEPVIFDCNVQ